MRSRGFFNPNSETPWKPTKEQNQTKTNTRKVSKAFLITGGTEETRKGKYDELYKEYQAHSYASYERGNELAVIFTYHNSDFEGMTFEEAKKLAGFEEIAPDFYKKWESREPCFGVIDLGGPEHKLSW